MTAAVLDVYQEPAVAVVVVGDLAQVADAVQALPELGAAVVEPQP